MRGREETFSTRSAARILAVSPERIRYWVKRRLIQPAIQLGRSYRFGFNDLLVMRVAKELLPSRHRLQPVQRSLARARELVEPGRPVSSLKLHNDDGRIVLSDNGILIEAETGQLLLDFRLDHERPEGKVEESFGPARVRERFEEARRLAEEDPLKALTIYSDLVGREPGNFEAHIRLATLLERDGDLTGALRHLLGAAAIVPASGDVHLRLGRLYRRRGDDRQALRSFLLAIDCDPTSVEAHRNAAELFDAIGRRRDAQRHLSAIHRLIKGD
ncbi:MAG TPA: MerR family transcriptional regulator [Candidatus Binataceae bacterium]|nr:MerR family transcriptional regulator [Candidatus Binataceae bacterium]